MANDIASIKKDKVNARTEINPKEQCNAITRSGREYGMTESEEHIEEEKCGDAEKEKKSSEKGK